MKACNCLKYLKPHNCELFVLDRNTWNFLTVCKQIITLGNNFLLFECCLDFYNWFRVFLHCWIRKWHPFLSIRSGFVLSWFEEKTDLVTKSITFLWHYQLIFVNIYHPKYVFKRKKCFANNIYWLPDRNIDYCKLNGGHW